MNEAVARDRYRRTRRLFPLVLAGYLVVAWSDWWLPRRFAGEIFPFFGWSLFSSPRDQSRLYTVRITRVLHADSPAARWLDETLDDPSRSEFLQNPRFQKTARAVAKAHWADDEAGRDRLAVQLGNFLRSRGVERYDLMVLNYHPLRYYLGEEEAEEELVHSFTVDR